MTQRMKLADTKAAKGSITRWLIAAGAAAAILALAWWQFGDAKPGRIDPDDARLVALGREVYAKHCASCHGANLEGQPDWRSRGPNGRMPAPPHDASGHTWHHPGDVLFGIVKDGIQKFAPPGYQSDMPAYAGVLTDTEIGAALSHIKSTWPDEVRRRHDELEKSARAR
jgi:mono/diheme cytochrome c family protein